MTYDDWAVPLAHLGRELILGELRFLPEATHEADLERSQAFALMFQPVWGFLYDDDERNYDYANAN